MTSTLSPAAAAIAGRTAPEFFADSAAVMALITGRDLVGDERRALLASYATYRAAGRAYDDYIVVQTDAGLPMRTRAYPSLSAALDAALEWEGDNVVVPGVRVTEAQ